MNTLLRMIGINSEFERLFFINEYKTLAGEKKRVIVMLIIILFLTLLALGYAVGSIENLSKKIDNPFTNWVDLNIREEYISKQARPILNNYTTPEQKELFQLEDVRGWVMYFLELYHQDFDPISHPSDTLAYGGWGRSLESDDPLLEKIIAPENLLWLSSDFTEEEEAKLSNCGIIITAQMLIRLGYDPLDQTIGNIFISERETVLPLKVVGVVKELPRFCTFVSSSQLYNIINAKRDGTKNCYDLVSRMDEGKNNFSFLIDEGTKLQQLKAQAQTYFQNSEPPEIAISNMLNVGKKTWSICDFSFFPTDKPSLDSIQAFLAFSTANGAAISNVLQIECGVDFCESIAPENFYYIAFNFKGKGLINVRAFRDDLKDQHNVEIDMSQVEAKENFALVSQLTFVISLILLGFGVLSIILFVNNLLRSHLSNVSSNLGTFKAFGLSNRFLNQIYLKIIFSFLIFSIVFALGAAVVIDRVEAYLLLEESKFNLFNSWILLALVTLVAISMISSARTIKKILGGTPGNLIYGR